MQTVVIQIHKTTAGHWTCHVQQRERNKQSLVVDIQLLV